MGKNATRLAHSSRLCLSQRATLAMPDRMHIPKVMQIEVVGWYRENSVRFVRLLAPRPVASLFFSLVALPLTVLHWVTYAKVCCIASVQGHWTRRRPRAGVLGHCLILAGPSSPNFSLPVTFSSLLCFRLYSKISNSRFAGA